MSSSSANYGLLMRKRPGLMSNESAIHPQPLDLSIRRQKVRQHWSGGSIVEVNETQQMHPPISVHSSVSDRCYSHYAVKPSPSFDTTLFSFNSGTEEKAFHQLHLQIHIPLAPVFPTSATLTPPSPASSSLDYNNSPPHSDRIHHHHHHHHHSHVPPQDKSAKRSRISMLVSSVSSVSSVAPVAAVPAVAPAAPAANPVVVDSDLQRLKHSQKHLRLSGYYYPHFSRKESVQLLQHTPIGTFLIRDSSDSRYLYAVSIQTEQGPTSVRIHYKDGSFRLDANNSCTSRDLPRFCSVPELIDFYIAKWNICKEKGQVWLDNQGQVHSKIILNQPVLQACPTLKHLSRLSWNRYSRFNSFRPDDVPICIQSFLKEYPFRN